MPSAGTVTIKLTMQFPLAGTVPPENEIELAPATGAKVGVPQPVVLAPVGFATTIAPGVVGNVSLKFTSLIAAAFGLPIVKVRIEVPPTIVGSGAKDFEIVVAVGSMIAAKRELVEKSLL